MQPSRHLGLCVLVDVELRGGRVGEEGQVLVQLPVLHPVPPGLPPLPPGVCRLPQDPEYLLMSGVRPSLT